MLKELEPTNEFYFIIGADMIEYLPNWHRIDELVDMVNFVGVKRPGYNEKTVYPINDGESPSDVHFLFHDTEEKAKERGKP